MRTNTNRVNFSRLEDIIDALYQVYNSSWLLILTAVFLLASTAWGFVNLYTNNKLSATTAVVFGNMRTVIIWAFFITPFTPFLCRVQVSFIF